MSDPGALKRESGLLSLALPILVILLACFVLTGCGGGGGSSTTTPPPVAPSITTQPQNQTVTAPATATFSVQRYRDWDHTLVISME